MVTIRSATVPDAPLRWKAEVETARGAGREEGRLRDRIRLPDGTFVNDIAMAWFPENGTV